MFLPPQESFSPGAGLSMSQHQDSVVNQIHPSSPYPIQEEKKKMANVLLTKYILISRWSNKKPDNSKMTSKTQSTPIPLGKEI